jgi:hypothetical protein
MRKLLVEFPMPVCDQCDRRAIDDEGLPAFHDSPNDWGTKPVFIDGRRCFRRYHLGGYQTMLDPDSDCPDYDNFMNRHLFPHLARVHRG